MLEYTFIFAFICLIWFWLSERSAAEAAAQLGKLSCQHAGVQWLDQNVQLLRRKIRRRADGRLSWERTYTFEFSSDGINRAPGQLVLHGLKLVSFYGPDKTLH